MDRMKVRPDNMSKDIYNIFVERSSFLRMYIDDKTQDKKVRDNAKTRLRELNSLFITIKELE